METHKVFRPPDVRNSDALEELRRIRVLLEQLVETLDTFCGTYLNSKFRYGKADDRWARRQ